jgi:hypothetical protein
MAGAHEILDMSFLAGGAITMNRLVEFSAAETVTQSNAVADDVIGVAMETCTAQDATDGRVIAVRVMGVALCKCGGAVTRGLRVRPTVDGRIQNMAGTAGVNEVQVGIALDTGVADDLVHVLLTPGARSNTAAS